MFVKDQADQIGHTQTNTQAKTPRTTEISRLKNWKNPFKGVYVRIFSDRCKCMPVVWELPYGWIIETEHML